MNPGAVAEVLAVLERLAREGWHRARGRLAEATLEAHPLEPALHAHRALAALETDGVDAARGLLRRSVVRFAGSGLGLPEAVIEAYRTLALVAAARDECVEHDLRPPQPTAARTLH